MAGVKSARAAPSSVEDVAEEGITVRWWQFCRISPPSPHRIKERMLLRSLCWAVDLYQTSPTRLCHLGCLPFSDTVTSVMWSCFYLLLNFELCFSNSDRYGRLGLSWSSTRGRVVLNCLPIRSSAGLRLHHGSGVE